MLHNRPALIRLFLSVVSPACLSKRSANHIAWHERSPRIAGMPCHTQSPILIPGGFADSDSSSSSDYGSDFSPEEEALLDELLAKVAPNHATVPDPVVAAPALSPPLLPVPIEASATIADIEDQYAGSSSRPLPRVFGREKPAWQTRRTWPYGARRPASIPGHRGPSSVEHPNSSEGREKERERQAARHLETTTNAVNTEEDTRSPVERFRRPPNKAFSVTDLISPAWCELQYWYSLTKHGRKRRTAAMKLGSTIHKTLEDEIYTTVPVEITTKEDALALRIWNIIQGLRLLREYGITRELEIWGLVDGELVTGVIDQLSIECPDPALEATAASYYADIEASRAILPEYQMSLTDYLLAPSRGGKRLSDVYGREEEEPEASTVEATSSQGSSELPSIPRVYLTDVKTRGSASVPAVKSSSFRPTQLQLQLYYHMLNRLITSDDVTIDVLAARYNLDAQRTFTDAFIHEVGGLNDQYFDALSSQEFDPDFIPTQEDADAEDVSSSPKSSSAPPASEDSTSILTSHNNLAALWNLMKENLRLTFLPQSQPSVSVAPSIPSEFQPATLESYPTVVSPLLTAKYISSKPTTEMEKRVLGSRSFLFDPNSLTSYVADQMEWWRGERAPRGVEVMDAWKCRICEFRDECEWRQEREWDYSHRRRQKLDIEMNAT